jgi:hypothetical protein
MANLMSAAREEFPGQRLTSFRVRRDFAFIAWPERPEQRDGHGNVRPITDWKCYLEGKLKRKVEAELEDGNNLYKSFADKLDLTPFVTLCEQPAPQHTQANQPKQ